MDHYEGHNGQITIDDHEITITREGMVARGSFPKGAAWTVPLRAISGVQFEDATVLKNGRLRVLVRGEQPHPISVGKTSGDVVLFTHKHRTEFASLRDQLQNVADRNRQQGVDFASVDLPPVPLSRHVSSQQRLANAVASDARVDTAGALFIGTSHEGGRNAVVTLFPDRLERVKPHPFGSLSKARQDVEITPLNKVSSLQAKKDGIFTKVTVYASGNSIEFRFGHGESDRFTSILSEHIASPSFSAPAAVPTIDLAEQLSKLAALRDQGILTDDEFAAQKNKLLA